MKTTITNITTKKLVNQSIANEINFDLAIQRGNVWKENQKSDLIYSVLSGFPTGIMYFRNNDTGYDAIDGKQRTTTMTEFLNNDLTLAEDFPTIQYKNEEFDFANNTFENLPEWAQDAINDYLFTICVIETNDEELSEFFFLINNGSPLSSIEKTRVKAISLDKFQEIAAHSMISLAISDRAKAGYKDEEVAMQMYAICYIKKPDFSTKTFRPLIQDIVVTEDQKNSIIESLDWVKKAYDGLSILDKDEKKIINKLKTKTHLVSALYLAYIFRGANRTVEDYCKAIYTFFSATGKNTSNSVEYNESCSNRSASETSVAKRVNAMNLLLNK